MRTEDKKIKIEDRISDEKLIDQLKKEWEKIETREKREQTIDKLKSGSKEVAKWLLITAAISGVLVVAAVAPNIFSAFGRSGLHRRFYKKADAEKALNSFKRSKSMKLTKKEGDTYYFEITPKAKRTITRFCLEELSIKKQEKWDGIWRIVIFDIPRKANTARDAIRKKLRDLGFYHLQMSTFIYPFECEEEINFLKDYYGLGNQVRLIGANYIDSDNDLKKIFQLS